MPTAAAKSEEFYQSTAQELQKQAAPAPQFGGKAGQGRKPETSRLHKAGRTLCCRVHKNR